MDSDERKTEGATGSDPDALLFRRFGGGSTASAGGAPVAGGRRPPSDRFAPPPGVERSAAPTIPPTGDTLRKLTAETAHDFNNLLSVVLSCASEIERAPADPGTRERAEEIRAAAERAAGLTRRLIDATRPTDEAVPPLDLSRTVTRCSRILSRTLGPDVELVIEPAAGLPRVRVSEEQAEQILLNLAGNASDAMPAGGTFTIRTRMVSVESGDPLLRPGWYVCLQTSDTGIGMSASQLERAFEPYYTTKHGAGAERGSGLGLPTIAEAARAAGGDARLDSEPGAGTTASIYLPAVRRSGEPLSLTAPRGGGQPG